MKYIVISLILFSFIQCNAMKKLIELKKKKEQKQEQRRLQRVAQGEKKHGQKRGKTIDECIRLLKAEVDEKSSSEN